MINEPSNDPIFLIDCLYLLSILYSLVYFNFGFQDLQNSVHGVSLLFLKIQSPPPFALFSGR